MHISFLDKHLKELCEQQRKATRRLGAKGARKLRGRLADLAAASRVTELVAGRPHPLRGDRAGQFALDLDGGRRLVFEPEDAAALSDAEGHVDWNAVTDVRIVFIGDYHD